MKESLINVRSDDGNIDCFVCHPEENGPYPAIIFYMDAPAIREELRDMARRLASVGYYVILPNLYYRAGTPEHYGFDYRKMSTDPEQRVTMFKLMNGLNNAMIVRDSGALLKHLRADPNARPGGVGCVGYCMSGRFVMSAAAAYPNDFAAIASYYGVGIITDQADSPHLQAHQIRGEVYLAFAGQDAYVTDLEVARMPSMLQEAGVAGRVEIYPDTDHGFAFPERPAYVKAAGERHWERMFALFERKLKS